MQLHLYHTAGTRSDRIHWLLEELDLSYKITNIDLFSGEGESSSYKKIHPHGQVPAIDIDGQILFESGAICQVLCDHFPEKKLAPTIGSLNRTEYEQWMFYAPATLEPYIYINSLHTNLLPEKNRIPDIVPWSLKMYINILKSLNTQMAKKKYLLGNNFSAADIMIGSVLLWRPDLLERFTTLNQYANRLEQRDAYQRSIGS